MAPKTSTNDGPLLTLLLRLLPLILGITIFTFWIFSTIAGVDRPWFYCTNSVLFSTSTLRPARGRGCGERLPNHALWPASWPEVRPERLHFEYGHALGAPMVPQAAS